MKNGFRSLVSAICCLFLTQCALTCAAQTKVSTIDSIATSIARYGRTNPASTLFVHFDKTVYSNFENVWFRAYLLNSSLPVDAVNVLSVFLVRNNDRSIWAESQYVMQDGLASGNLFLTDSLPPGNYSFVTYTNHIVNGRPDEVFVQPVTIKTIEGDFNLSLQRLNPDAVEKDSAKLLLKAYTKEYKVLKEAKLKYSIGGNGSFKENRTDKLGEYRFNIPLTTITPGNNILHVEMRNGFLYKHIAWPLPVKPRIKSVRFYPEGGHLIAETPVLVGWEVKNDKGEPLAVNGFLYENGMIIDTLSTNEDGMGHFSLTAKSNSRYLVKLSVDSPASATFDLPVALPKAPAMQVLDAIANDTLHLMLRNINDPAFNLYILLHDYQSVFRAFSVKKGNPTQYIQIPLEDIPKGVFTITLLGDSLRPIAERICFAHYNDRNIADIKIDTSVYQTRKPVKLTINILSTSGEPINGMVSVSCVQANRVEPGKVMDIESYLYLSHSLSLQTNGRSYFTADAQYNSLLENTLLIKGWRKYTWQDMVHASDTVLHDDQMVFMGTIRKNKKRLKLPVDIGVMNDTAIQIIGSDHNGIFELPNKSLVIKPDKKLLLFVNSKSQDLYDVDVINPYASINRKLSAEIRFENYDIMQRDKSPNNFSLAKDEHVKILDAVTVKSKNGNDDFYGQSPVVGRCTDYICQNGIVNCPGHPQGSLGNTRPVNGHYYYILTSRGGYEFIRYISKCDLAEKNKYLVSIDGIYTNKEFYVTDLTQSVSKTPEYLSTLYWNPAVVVNSLHAAELTFFTSDISGSFKIVVQGRTDDDDVIYGQQFFTVKENQ